MSGGLLDTNGTFVIGSIAYFEAWDTIRCSGDEPLAQVSLALTDSGTLDLSDELAVGFDATGDGLPDDRGAEVWACDYGNAIVTVSGDDRLYGGSGDDVFRAGAGNDVIRDFFGGANSFDGGDGDDWIEGAGGNDTLLGGDGNDLLTDSGGTNLLDGGRGDDRLTAYGIGDTLLGGDGDDRLECPGLGLLDGGDGDDVLVVGFASRSRVEGGAGLDAIVLIDSDNGSIPTLEGLAFSNVEVLRSQGANLQARTAQLDAFIRIESDLDPLGRLGLFLADAGTADLSGKLGTGLDRDGDGVEDDRPIDVHASAWGNAITTGSGDDTLTGGLGDDILRGGPGADTLVDLDPETGTSHGTNLLDGGGGDDTFRLGAGVLGSVDGGTGTDTLVFGGDLSGLAIANVERLVVDGDIVASAAQISGFDSIEARHGSGTVRITLLGAGLVDLAEVLGDQAVEVRTSDLGAVLVTGSGDDTLAGGAGDDVLAGLGGDDALTGGGGDDTLLGGNGADLLDGGGGVNTVSYAGGTGVTVALDGSLAATNAALGDSFARIANLSGSSAADWLRGDADANLLDGGAGADRLDGMEGDDIFLGGAGADRHDGGGGTDQVTYAGSGAVIVALDGSLAGTGDALGDTFALVENLTGSSQGDRLRGDGLANTLAGGDGNDRIEGMAGADLLLGGNGDDTLVGGLGKDVLTGGAGADDFVWLTLRDSGPGTAARDTVWDFAKGFDDIVLAAIDAKAGVAGNQAFVLDKNGSFSIGEVRQAVVAGNLLIELNTDGDPAAEMSILLHGLHTTLGASDFVL